REMNLAREEETDSSWDDEDKLTFLSNANGESKPKETGALSGVNIYFFYLVSEIFKIWSWILTMRLTIRRERDEFSQGGGDRLFLG
ncbi:hypothetical protein, partial [Streptococcus pseudopneumoniae]